MRSFSNIMENENKPTKFYRSREYWEQQDKPYLIAEIESMTSEILSLKK